MINFYNQVPSVYIKTSRDFQYLSWLINVVLNYVKHNVDDLYYLPNNTTDSRLTELLAMTLGFKIKRNYDQRQLAALIAIIPQILKYKGTPTAFELAGNALIRSSGANGTFKYEIRNNCIEAYFPEDLVDTALFRDLLPYILPAGLTCRIVRSTQIDLGTQKTVINTEDLFYYSIQEAKDLAVMFDTSAEPVLSNFIIKGDEKCLNAGLVDNSIILADGLDSQDN